MLSLYKRVFSVIKALKKGHQQKKHIQNEVNRFISKSSTKTNKLEVI